MHGETEDVCIRKRRVCVHGEREGVNMEGVKCACMGRGRVCAYERSSVREWGEDECIWKDVCRRCVHMEGSSVCIWKESCACMGRGRVCIWKGWSVHVCGEGGVYMEGVECAWMRRERMRVHGRV